MFKIWSIIILGCTMLSTGIAVMSLDHRGSPTADQLAFTGVWSGGSGERAFMTCEDGFFQLRITDSRHAVLLSCTKGNLLNGCIVFTNLPSDCSADQHSWAYIKVEMSGDTITVDGYGPSPVVFRRAQPE